MSLKIIDLSSHNGNVNFSQVKECVDGVILRLGYRGYAKTGKLVKDTLFEYNFTQCKKYNIPVGVYWFTTAVNKEEVLKEIYFINECLKNRSVDFPVYIDSEYSNVTGTGRSDNLGVVDRTNILVWLCEGLKNIGYEVGVYASDDWFKNHLKLSQLENYSLWVARYSKTAPKNVKNYHGWQYTSKGQINGVKGNCDISHFDDNFISNKEVVEMEKIYNSLSEVPTWWKDAVSWAIENRILLGDEKGNLCISESNCKTLVFLYRYNERTKLVK